MTCFINIHFQNQNEKKKTKTKTGNNLFFQFLILGSNEKLGVEGKWQSG